jgi:hypothetical protein
MQPFSGICKCIWILTALFNKGAAMFKHTIVFLIAVQLFSAPFVSAKLYMWTDENGIKRISNTVPPGQVDFQEENEKVTDTTVYNQKIAAPATNQKAPAPPALKVDKPKKHKKTSTKANSKGPVIVPPSDGSYWKCTKYAGKNFDDLMDCAQDSLKIKDYDLSYDCSFCARELRSDDIEAIILNFKANYYSSHNSEDRARAFLIEIISRQIKEQPDEMLVAFKKWVEGGKEVDAFKVK